MDPAAESSPGPGALDAWCTPGRFAALLAVFFGVAFPDVLLGIRTFVFRDFGNFAYPLAFYQREAFWRGELPLWNPLNDCGLPFLAQWNTMTLYPGSLFYLLLPLSWSLAVFCLLHLWFGGLGMYCLARRCTGRALPAAVAGVAFAWSGLSLNSLMWTNNSAALGWMPWVVLAVTNAAARGGRPLVLAALAGALQMLTGAPEIILFTWTAIGAWGLAEGLAKQTPWRQLARRLAGVGVLVAGLAAAQLGPFLDLLAHSQRDAAFTDASWPMPGWGWANLFVPLFFSFPMYHGVYFQYDQGWTSSYYLGLAVLGLAVFGAWRVRDRRVRALTALALVGLVLALGNRGVLYEVVRRVLPQISLVRFPVKFIVLTAFAAPLLAAFALAHWWRASATDAPREQRRGVALWSGLVVVAGAIVWFARAYPQYDPPYGDWPGTARNALVRVGFLTAIFAAAWRLRTIALPRQAAWLGMLLLGAVWLDVWTHAPNQNPTITPAAYAPGLSHFTASAATPGPRAMISPNARATLYTDAASDIFTNYFCNRLALNGNLNLLDAVPKPDGFYSLQLRDYAPVGQLLYATRRTELPALMDFLGVGQVTSPGKFFDWTVRPGALPLVTAGQAPVFAAAETTLHSLTNGGFDPRRTVFLPPETRTQVSVTNASAAEVFPRQSSAHALEFGVSAPGPALVVVAQAFYHPWRAWVDGRPVPLWRANHGFQALEVPAGDHAVRLVYQDRRFLAGAAVSVACLAVCAGGWWRGRDRKRPALN